MLAVVGHNALRIVGLLPESMNPQYAFEKLTDNVVMLSFSDKSIKSGISISFFSFSTRICNTNAIVDGGVFRSRIIFQTGLRNRLYQIGIIGLVNPGNDCSLPGYTG
jgi:hypothetical protein